jgi:hypothetical protein
MEVSEVIAIAREKSEDLAKLARILARLKPTLYATGTSVQWRDDDVAFHCMTDADALKVAAAIPAPLELAYHGASTILTGRIVLGTIEFNFFVQTIRKIRLEQCEVKRKKRPSSIGWFEATLLFNGLEIAKMNYLARQFTPKTLKQRLWEIAIREKKEKERLEKFDLVL